MQYGIFAAQAGRKFLTLLVACQCLLFPFAREISATAVPGGLHSKAEILSEVVTAKSGESIFLAIIITLEKGWHTYYKNPGDSGAPLTIRFADKAITAGDLAYPPPEKITVPPLTSFGYHGRVILLLPVSINSAEKKIRITGKLDYLECREECLPAGGQFAFDLAVAEKVQPNAAAAEIIQTAKAKLPQALPYPLTQAGEQRYRIALPITPREVMAFPDPQGSADVQVPEIIINDHQLELNFAQQKAVSAGLLLSLRDDQGWSHWQLQLPQSAQRGFFVFLLMAFLGGILLNFMPCVLPVLSVKAISIIRSSATRPASSHKIHWGYALGVVTTMVALGTVFLLLRASGSAVGWGFQLQNPVFVALLVLLFAVISANLFGAFEIPAPVINTAPALGEFATGIIAVIAATPCTAPFMATALGAALTLHPVQGFFVFVSLGAGMALPFVLLEAIPAAARLLPRPGEWFATFKTILGFLMAGSALWLASVFDALTGQAILLLAAALVFVLALYLASGTRRAAMRVTKVLRVVTLLLAIAAGIGLTAEAITGRARGKSDERWQSFSAAAREQALASQHRVFIDFTADWCLTCKVNERIAFTDAVYALFRQKQVVLLKADFTARDAAIADELSRLGRAGVPVYVFYERGGKREFWNEVLTESAVKERLQNLTQ